MSLQTVFKEEPEVDYSFKTPQYEGKSFFPDLKIVKQYSNASYSTASDSSHSGDSPRENIQDQQQPKTKFQIIYEKRHMNYHSKKKTEVTPLLISLIPIVV